MTTHSRTEILSQLQTGAITVEQADKLLAEIAQHQEKALTYKVSEKGAISFYGLRRMPITLYHGEVTKLSEVFNSAEFKQWIDSHQNELAKKTH